MRLFVQGILESSINHNEDYSEYSLDEVYEGVEESVDADYNAKTVPICRVSESEYQLRYDDLMSVVKTTSVEQLSAANESVILMQICKENGIDISELTVVLPSKAEMDAFSESCCKSAKGCKTESEKCKEKEKTEIIKESMKKIKNSGVKCKVQK